MAKKSLSQHFRGLYRKLSHEILGILRFKFEVFERRDVESSINW